MKWSSAGLVLAFFFASFALAEDGSVVQDVDVEVDRAVSLGSYFEKIPEGEPIHAGMALIPVVPMVAGYGVQWWLIRSESKNLKPSALRAKKYSVLRGLNATTTIWLFTDALAGVYVYAKGYRPKFIGNFPALVSYLAKNPSALQNFGKEIDPGANLTKDERRQLEQEVEGIHSGAIHALPFLQDPWIRD